MGGPRLLTWMGVRRALPRAVTGLAALALPPLAFLDRAEAAKNARKKRRKRCKKQCKKLHKRCDNSCHDLPDGDRDLCQQECQIAHKQCKKTC